MRNNTAQQTLAFTATVHARLIGFTPLPTEIVEIFFFFSHVKPEQQQWKLNEWSVFFQRKSLVDNTSNSAQLAWIGLRNRFEAQDCAPTTPATFSILMLRQRQRISPHCKRRERQKVFTPEHSRATATPVCVIFWLLTSRVQDEAIGKPSLSSIVWTIFETHSRRCWRQTSSCFQKFVPRKSWSSAFSLTPPRETSFRDVTRFVGSEKFHFACLTGLEFFISLPENPSAPARL